MNNHHLGQTLAAPGQKYAFLYNLADPTYSQSAGACQKGNAGKLMAASAMGDANRTDEDADALIDHILSWDTDAKALNKCDFSSSPYFNSGTDNTRFHDLAAKFSDTLFDRFHRFAKANLTKGYPLLISGGCGLNCD